MIATLLFPLFAVSCQYLPMPGTDQEQCSKTDPDKNFSPVKVGSISNDGLLETKYNQIQRGMDKETVAGIMGRNAGCFVQVNWMEICCWSESCASISVWFDHGGKSAFSKDIKPTMPNEGQCQVKSD